MSKPTYEELEQALRDIEEYSRSLRTCTENGKWDETPIEAIGTRARMALQNRGPDYYWPGDRPAA